jgi:hypothetical protein
MAFILCNSETAVSQTFDPPKTGPYEGVSGTFFVRTYLVYIETSMDQWLDDISTRNQLDALQSAELSDFIYVLSVLQPHLSGSAWPGRLPGSALDSLKDWASYCTEAGLLAREILLRNGIEVATDCGSEQQRTSSPIDPAKTSLIKNDVRIYPNPAEDFVYIEFPDSQQEFGVVIYAADGRPVLQRTLYKSGQVDVSQLPGGLYLLKSTPGFGVVTSCKFFISR